MFSVAWLKRKIRTIVHKVWPLGVDRTWKAWHENAWPQIVKAGPPADLSERESRRNQQRLIADLP